MSHSGRRSLSSRPIPWHRPPSKPRGIALAYDYSILEALVPKSLTVGQLLHQLRTLDPDLPIYLAINPDWPYAHRTGYVIEDRHPSGTGAVYIAEDGQAGVLCPGVRGQLDWSQA
ncbi:hypothetical protein ACTWJ8_31965 [Streptomyces sp. SDT5-1]|uniref:hypothetical protein n=1 Tax=Streptomyces sp. SDT5-1 TaxID=3406418 RepID=UPI003FD622FD